MVWSGFPAGALIYLGCPSGFRKTHLGSGPKPVLPSVLGLLSPMYCSPLFLVALVSAPLLGIGLRVPHLHRPHLPQLLAALLMSVRSQADFPFRPLRTWWEIPTAQISWGSSAV